VVGKRKGWGGRGGRVAVAVSKGVDTILIQLYS
jgi:hypothetical protein